MIALPGLKIPRRGQQGKAINFFGFQGCQRGAQHPTHAVTEQSHGLPGLLNDFIDSIIESPHDVIFQIEILFTRSRFAPVEQEGAHAFLCQCAHQAAFLVEVKNIGFVDQGRDCEYNGSALWSAVIKQAAVAL